MEQQNEIEKEIEKSEIAERMKKRPYFTLSDEEVAEQITRHRDLMKHPLVSAEEKERLFSVIEGYENELKQRK